MNKVVSLSHLLLVVGACACGRAEEPTEGAAQPSQPHVVSIPQIEKDVDAAESPRGPIAGDAEMQDLVSLAKEDLARLLGAAVDAIDVLEARRVTWRNSALGCPQPGVQYLDVLTDGALIRLRTRGKTFHYHSGGNRPPLLCSNPSAPYRSGDA